MPWLRYITAVLAWVTIAHPVLMAYSYKEGRGRPGIWIISFLLFAAMAMTGAIYEINLSEAESQATTGRFQVLLNQVQMESLRLVPSDFQIRLTSKALKGVTSDFDPASDVLHITGRLDSALFQGEMTVVDEYDQPGARLHSIGYDRRRHGLAGGGRKGIRYYTKNLTFDGLEDYPYLGDLSGAEFEMRVPFDRAVFKPGSWSHSVDLYIKGRHFAGVLDSNGVASISIVIPSNVDMGREIMSSENGKQPEEGNQVQAIQDGGFSWEVLILLLTAIIMAWSAGTAFRKVEFETRPTVAFGLGKGTNGSHIFFYVQNISKTDAEALVDLRLFVNKRECQLIDRAYSGGLMWNANFGHISEGHKDLAPLLASSQTGNPPELTLVANVAYRRYGSRRRRFLKGKIYYAPPMEWKYDHGQAGFTPTLVYHAPDKLFSCTRN